MPDELTTRPATWEDVKRVAELFAAAGVQYALIGGYAIAAHGYNRFSEDIDVLVDPAPENTERWIRALANLPDGAATALTGQNDIFQREGEKSSSDGLGARRLRMASRCERGSSWRVSKAGTTVRSPSGGASIGPRLGSGGGAFSSAARMGCSMSRAPVLRGR